MLLPSDETIFVSYCMNGFNILNLMNIEASLPLKRKYRRGGRSKLKERNDVKLKDNDKLD